MKKDYKSPQIIFVAVENKQELLTASNLVNNVNLNLGNGGSGEARSRQCRMQIDNDNDFEHDE